MRRKTADMEMRAEYDFSRGVRGKYYRRYIESSNVVVLEPDVHRHFKNSAAVNKALRSVIRSAAGRRASTKRPVRMRSKGSARGN